jgi:hypothetical protein
MASPWFNILNPNNVHGAWESDAARIEEIYLQRREHNQRGYGPTSARAKPTGLAHRLSPEADTNMSPMTDLPPEPKPKRAKKTPPLERRLSLEEMARQITGKHT